MLQIDSFSHAEAVVISSANHVLARPSYIYVGGGGSAKTLVVITHGGETVTFTGMVTGQVLPILVKTVVKDGTDATLMVALS